MLAELRIENFAIIDRLDLRLGAGLVAFTGETGAGKSIILDAIIALVGGRADATAIRAGAERALVEAVFRLPEATRPAIHAILEREGLLDDPDFLSIGRELRREGRSIARVNGRSVNISLLRELGEYLVDIHGQSEHLSLLNVRQHIGLLDRFAGVETELQTYRQLYRQLLGLRRELKELREAEADADRRKDLLTFQAQEIEAAHLRPDEEDDLRRERDRLANAESLASLAEQAIVLLEGGSDETPAISDLLGRVVQAVHSLSRLDSSQAKLADQLTAASEALSDLGRELQDYREQIEFNPRRLEQVEERLDLLNTLKRKYGGSLEAVLAYGQEARRKLESIEHSGERIAELEADEQALLEKIAQAGELLSEKRQSAAEELARRVELELADLSMAGARFRVDFQRHPDAHGAPAGDGQRVAFDDTGFDRVEFLIAPNPGEGFKPLVKIASGGETSRLMLALKNVLVSADHVPTLIFDEIDQGIGGRVGSVVGEKLWRLGVRHQVLCVTHLPQLAAFGDQHLHVLKELADGRTITRVETLEGPRRLDELAQMLGGLNDANRSAAQVTLQEARRRADELRAAGD
ncbi:MAG: DNA repair protein RecN [Anaerolineae bacterium]|nr:DNA repair protein RecN [Anaerolineae bacterium]